MKTRIGDISIQIRGVSYKPSDISDENDPQSIAILRANNISNHGEIETSDLVWITQNRVKPEQILRTGDILLCASSGSKGLVGKAAQVTGDYGMSFGAFCKVIRPMIANKKYLGFYFQSPQYRHLISEASAGININNIRAEDLDGLVIEIPSESEQDERCSVLDKVEKAILLRRQQIQKLNDLVKSQFIEMFGNPQINEKGYSLLRVDDVIEFQGGSQPDKSFFEYTKTDNNVRLIQIRDYKTDKFVTYIPKNMAKRYCYADDIMIGRYGPPIFQILQGIEGSYNVALMKAIPKKGNKEFIRQFLKQDCLLHYLEGLSKRTAGQDGIQMDKLKQYPFPYPPIELQNQFARFVEQTDKSKFRIKQSLEKLEILYKALLQKYFG